MECLERPIWTDYSREELEKLRIGVPNEGMKEQVLKNWDKVAKPLDGMGRFEGITAKIGAILNSDTIDISKKAVVIMCGDNGIVEEGISQSRQEVTLAVAGMMGQGLSSVCRMAKTTGADTIPVDIGLNFTGELPGVISKNVRCGTRNFHKEPAMTEQEVIKAIAVGIEMVAYCKEAGYKILATGEAGIGNTTTSSAVATALLQCHASEVTGRGAGLSDAGLVHKRQIIEEAIQKYDLYHAEPFVVLQTVGGLDIAGLVGICIGGAMYGIPIVLDGVISLSAALLAERMFPGTKEFYIPSHIGKEPAIKKIAEELNLEPVIDGKLALGEGTGAVMMFPLLDMALSVYQNRTTFEDIKLEQYTRV